MDFKKFFAILYVTCGLVAWVVLLTGAIPAKPRHQLVETAVYFGEAEASKRWVLSHANVGWRVTTLEMAGEGQFRRVYIILNR